MRLDALIVETPIELQTHGQRRRQRRLTVAPPRQAAETTVMPVLHRIRITWWRTDDDDRRALDAGRVDSVDDRNRAWNLKSFMDSLIVELDRAQDVLAVKGLTRPVTYTVKDVDVDLRCFPQFDGRSVRFRTAQPGQDGSSGLRFSLGSISAGTIRDSAPPPPEPDDIRLDAVEDLDQDTIEALESVGVRSGRDLQRVAARGVDLKRPPATRRPTTATSRR